MRSDCKYILFFMAVSLKTQSKLFTGGLTGGLKQAWNLVKAVTARRFYKTFLCSLKKRFKKVLSLKGPERSWIVF